MRRSLAPQITSRSIYLGRRKTSVRLEPVIWDALEEIAEERGTPINALLYEIKRDHMKAAPNLSSAIRVYVVEHYRAASKGRV